MYASGFRMEWDGLGKVRGQCRILVKALVDERVSVTYGCRESLTQNVPCWYGRMHSLTLLHSGFPTITFPMLRIAMMREALE